MLVWVFGFRRLDFLLVLCFELVVLFVLVAVWRVLSCCCVCWVLGVIGWF